MCGGEKKRGKNEGKKRRKTCGSVGKKEEE